MIKSKESNDKNSLFDNIEYICDECEKKVIISFTTDLVKLPPLVEVGDF